MLPQLFEGRRCFVLGGGPSLTREVCDRLRGRHAIVINSTARLAPWAEVLFFSDAGWFRDHRGIVDPWPGLVITASLKAYRRALDRLHLVRPPTVKAETATSGHHALDAAAALGAVELVFSASIAGRSTADRTATTITGSY